MKVPYQFSVLRYVYDPLTQEFLNVGIVAYSPKTRQLRARCTQHYSRISSVFQSFDGIRLRQTLRYIQDRLNDIGDQLDDQLEFASRRCLEEILASVLPVDDSSLQFAKGGLGLSEDLIGTTESLFIRYVEKYALAPDLTKRADEDVWRTFRGPLDRRSVTSHLVPKRIVAKNYEYEFQRAWKNGVWNIIEPLSFDLLDGTAIREKANRWVGRAIGLEDSPEPFKLYLLLGEPSDSRLNDSFRKAENLLHRMPVPHEFIQENEAESFASELAADIEEHESL